VDADVFGLAVEGWSGMGRSLWLLVSGRQSDHRSGAAGREVVTLATDYQGSTAIYIFARADLWVGHCSK
jgi:hypothetical protein